VDRRIREQPLGHLVGAIGGLVGVGGVEVDLEPVGRPEVRQLEPEPFERACWVVSASGSRTPRFRRTVTVAVYAVMSGSAESCVKPFWNAFYIHIRGYISVDRVRDRAGTERKGQTPAFWMGCMQPLEPLEVIVA